MSGTSIYMYVCIYIYTYILIRQYGLIKDNSGRITDIANLICLQFFTWVQGERSIIWNAGKPHVKSRHGRFCILVTDWVTLNWVMIRKNSRKIEQQNWIHQNPSESVRKLVWTVVGTFLCVWWLIYVFGGLRAGPTKFTKLAPIPTHFTHMQTVPERCGKPMVSLNNLQMVGVPHRTASLI